MDYWSTHKLIHYRLMKVKLIAEKEKNSGMINKAKVVVENLGKEEKISNQSSLSNQYCCVYEGCDLKIVEQSQTSTGEKNIYVEYKGECVLSNAKYVHGVWENILLELYKNIAVISDTSEKEKYPAESTKQYRKNRSE